MATTEFEVIRRWFSGLGGGDHVHLGVGDDAAIVALPEGHLLHVSTDTLVAGRHFLDETLPEDIAYRAVAAAASDLAAMGAEALGITLSLTIPDADALWLHGFSQGLADAVTEFGLPLVGGDTTRGPCAITVTVLGSAPAGQWLHRAGAKPGDRLCVTGTLGDAALALAMLEGRLSPDLLPDLDDAHWLEQRFARPTPRLELGKALRGCASAAIDVSDGLLADAAHLASASGVSVSIDSALLPLSGAMTRYADREQAMQWALSGGDDYELLFTLPVDHALPSMCTQIGSVAAGSGVHTDCSVTRGGYDHFDA